jgi:serine/threonine protein kinase
MDLYDTEKVLGSGLEATVYQANDSYASYLARQTRGEYGHQFAVKHLVRFDFYRLLDELEVCTKLSFYSFPHIIPLLHWIVLLQSESRDFTVIDSRHLYTPGETTEEMEPNPTLLSHLELFRRTLKLPIGVWMTYPLMDGTLESIDLSQFSRNQRLDMCLQMISMIQSLRSVNVCHNDFRLRNILFRLSDENLYLFLADFGFSCMLTMETMVDRPRRLVQDYEFLVFNISFVLTEGEQDPEKATARLLEIYDEELVSLSMLLRNMDPNDYNEGPALLTRLAECIVKL